MGQVESRKAKTSLRSNHKNYATIRVVIENKLLKNNNLIDERSKLFRLIPYFYELSILQVGGRLPHAAIP